MVTGTERNVEGGRGHSALSYAAAGRAMERVAR
jgi:hypothetical protein